MTDNQLDDIFKKHLSRHVSSVPEDMWGRINRKKDKDRKGFFFFFSLIGLFLLGFGVAGILLFNKNDKHIVRNKDHINDNETISKSDTVKSTGTDQNMKANPSVNQEAAFGREDTVLNTARHKEYPKNRKLTRYSNKGILEISLNQENKSSESGQSKSKNDTAIHVLESDVSPDSNKKSDLKANLIVTSTPKPNTADSVKTGTSKKADSTKKNNGNKWSLDLYVSPDYPIDYGEEYVTGKLSYTAGLRLNRSFGNRFSGKIGIQYSKLNYNFTDSNRRSGTDQMRSLDLPVLAGYSWGNKSFGMTINAGVVFNLYSWSRGDSLSYSSYYFKTNTGLSLYLGIHLEKQIKDQLSFFAEPYYRYRLSSMTVSTVYFLKFIDVAGVSFGVRYYFKK